MEDPPQQGWESFSATWVPTYRATGALTAELLGEVWSFRVEAGLGLLLNSPQCRQGSCPTSGMNADLEPRRFQPSLSASLGFHLGSPSSAPAGYRSPGVAAGLSMAATAVPLAAAFVAWDHGHESLTLAFALAGVSLGPSVGHFYAGEPTHALAFAALRAGGAFLGGALALTGNPLGLVLALGVPVLAIYDFIDGAAAAERTNLKNGLSRIAVVPTSSAAGPAPSHGLALVGTF